MPRYTPDVIMRAFAVPDENVDITGYLAEVEMPKVVGQKKKYDILKFILKNHETTAIQCCIWGISSINKYKAEMTIGTVNNINLFDFNIVSSQAIRFYFYFRL